MIEGEPSNNPIYAWLLEIFLAVLTNTTAERTANQYMNER
jgi:hypothetical protein